MHSCLPCIYSIDGILGIDITKFMQCIYITKNNASVICVYMYVQLMSLIKIIIMNVKCCMFLFRMIRVYLNDEYIN